MKQTLIRIVEEKEIHTAPYIDRIHLEYAYFAKFEKELNALKKLKSEGHIIYPELNTGCSSLILHLIGMNPVNPLELDLPFLMQEAEDFSFYANLSAVKKNSSLPLSALQLLSELQIVCHYLQIDLDDISNKLIQETHIHYFIADLLENPELRGRSYYLVDTTVDCFDQLENCRATTFEELVRFVFAIYIEQNPHANEPGKIAEAYMDVLMTGWIWWLGKLAK
jgi:hypothetical protein